MAESQSIISHVSVGTNDFERAVAFYDAVLLTLGCRRVMEHADTVAWGKSYPEFWVHVPIDGQQASVGNGTHVCFDAATEQKVHDFYEAALEAGGTADGPPGPRPHYGEPYYGCFVRDLDGAQDRGDLLGLGQGARAGHDVMNRPEWKERVRHFGNTRVISF